MAGRRRRWTRWLIGGLAVIALVRPTAVLLWPNNVSLMRYPASEPVEIFHVPATPVVETSAAPAVVVVEPVPAAPALVPAVVGVVSVEMLSGGGALPSMKWMYTNGPPTTSTTMTATAPINHRVHRRLRPATDRNPPMRTDDVRRALDQPWSRL